MAKISIIIPIYNVERYLNRCLDSVINQTLKDVEIILVDDCSNDNSYNIAKDYAKKYKNITLIKNKKNKGLASARNAGLEIASGEFVGFVDSDDWIEPDTYKTALNKMTDDVDCVIWGINVINENLKENSKSLKKITEYCVTRFVGKQYITPTLLIATTVMAWNKLYRKSIIDKNNLRFPNGLFYEDNEFFYKYCCHCRKIYFSDKYFYNYVQRENSIMYKSYNKKSPKITDRLIVFSNIYEYYKNHNLLNKNKKILEQLFMYYFIDDFENCSMIYKLKVLNFASSIAQKCFSDSCETELAKELNNKNYYNVIRLLYSNTLNKSWFNPFDLKEKTKKTVLLIRLFLNSSLTCKNNKTKAKTQKNNNAKSTLKLKELEDLKTKISNDLKITAPKKIKQNYNIEVLDALNQLNKFYFLPNYGNLGDVVIAESEYQLLNSNNYNYTVLSQVNKLNDKFDFVYGGGGLFVNYWNYQSVLEIFKNKHLRKCVILPSSFWLCEDVLEILDERFTVFCREKNSYNYCTFKNKRAKFILADDMAFSLSFKHLQEFNAQNIRNNLDKLTLKNYGILKQSLYPKYQKLHLGIINDLSSKTVIKNGYKIGYFLRTDEEKHIEYIIKNSIDLSVFACSTSTDSGIVNLLANLFTDAVNSVDVVITDRLHVGIVAALLNKKVFLLDNSYAKVSGVLEQSMKNMPNVTMLNDMTEFNPDSIIVDESKADINQLKNRVTDFQDFINIYLSKAKLDKEINDTIYISDSYG